MGLDSQVRNFKTPTQCLSESIKASRCRMFQPVTCIGYGVTEKNTTSNAALRTTSVEIYTRYLLSTLTAYGNEQE